MSSLAIVRPSWSPSGAADESGPAGLPGAAGLDGGGVPMVIVEAATGSVRGEAAGVSIRS
jgi:hypothetical protein